MNAISSGWLAGQMARLVEAPSNRHSVVSVHVSQEATRNYVHAVQERLAREGSYPPDEAESCMGDKDNTTPCLSV